MDKDTTAFWQRFVIVAALGFLCGMSMNIRDVLKEIRDDARQWHSLTESERNER